MPGSKIPDSSQFSLFGFFISPPRRYLSQAETIKAFIGRTFGRWTVLSFTYRKGRALYFLCRCQCGAERPVMHSTLSAGTSRSCGCIQRRGEEHKRERSKQYHARYYQE